MTLQTWKESDEPGAKCGEQQQTNILGEGVQFNLSTVTSLLSPEKCHHAKSSKSKSHCGKFFLPKRWAPAVRSELVHYSPLEGSSRTRYSFSPVLIRMTLLTSYFRVPTLVQGSVFPVNSHLMTDRRYDIASCWVGVGIISDRVNFL